MQTSTVIHAIVFDLDGTLYVCERFAAEIQNAATEYIARLRGVTIADAEILMAATRVRLSEASGTVQTISAVCRELGGSVQELHRFFQATLKPESHLVRDERVILLLERLKEHFDLYIYTNNNRVLTTRIIGYLGLEHTVRGVFTVDDTWRGKPDEEMVKGVLEEIGRSPRETLFVGDRYDVDLRLPEKLGCPVFLSQSIEQLLRLEELLTQFSPADTPAALENHRVALS